MLKTTRSVPAKTIKLSFIDEILNRTRHIPCTNPPIPQLATCDIEMIGLSNAVLSLCWIIVDTSCSPTTLLKNGSWRPSKGSSWAVAGWHRFSPLVQGKRWSIQSYFVSPALCETRCLRLSEDHQMERALLLYPRAPSNSAI